MKKLTKIISPIFLSLGLFFYTGCASDTGVRDDSLDDIFDFAISTMDAISSVARAIEGFNPDQEYMMGLAVANSICQIYQISDQTETGDYLNKICTTLTINSLYPYHYRGYHVIVVHSDDLNALSTPGGHIFITDGLLKICKSEDEVAAVIAHEIAHIQLKHSINLIRSKRAINAIRDIGFAGLSYLAIEDNDIKQAVDELHSARDIINDTLFEKGFSKAQEEIADKTALKLLYDAGYNPAAMKDLFYHLDEYPDGKYIEKTDSKPLSKKEMRKARRKAKRKAHVYGIAYDVRHSISALNKTHPSPKERLKYIDRYLREYKGRYYEDTREDRFDANRIWF